MIETRIEKLESSTQSKESKPEKPQVIPAHTAPAPLRVSHGGWWAGSGSGRGRASGKCSVSGYVGGHGTVGTLRRRARMRAGRG